MRRLGFEVLENRILLAGDFFVELDKLTAGDAAAGNNFGGSVAVSADGTTVVVGSQFDDEAGNNSGAALVYTWDASSSSFLEQKLAASDADAADNFGISVAVSADGLTVVVGAHGDDAPLGDSGSAYVFTRATLGSSFIAQQLTASDGAAGDRFGWSVAVSGEGNTVVVGARTDDGSGSNSGSAYVFDRNAPGSLFSQQQKLTASDAAGDDQFGWSVATLADGETILVGAHNNDDAGSNSGSVYVYQFDALGLTYVQQQKLTASDAAAGDEFGYSVALSADGLIAVVGARHNDDAGSNSGSAYLFEWDGISSFVQQQKLTASDPAVGDEFGYSVSVTADGEKVAVGALNDDDAGSNSGSAYVYEWDGINSIFLEQKLTAGDADATHGFGSSVSISADGRAFAVGAPFDDDAGSTSGSAYVFNTALVVTTKEDELDPVFDASDLSLREAIDIANATAGADVITFDANLFTATGSVPDNPILLTQGELSLTESVTIVGLGPELVAIDAQSQSRVFNITAATGGFRLAGLTLMNGRTSGDNAPFLETTHSGGAIRSVTSGDLRLDRCIISGNATTGDFATGGGVHAQGDVTLNSSTVSGNSTMGQKAHGGGIYAAGNVTLSQTTVSGNHTAGNNSDGGGIWADLRVTATLSTVSENFTSGNFARGGGIWAGDATVIESTISGNHTLANYGDGGGMFVDGDALLTESTVSGNYTKGLIATGGGIVCTYHVTLIRSTVSGNRTTGPRADGGGIFAFHATVFNSTISGNSATGRGGGIQSLSETGSGYITLISHSTITGNTADTDDDGFGYGGGICGDGGDAMVLFHAIIAGNIDISDRAADVVAFGEAPTSDFSLIGDNAGTDLVASPVGRSDEKGNFIGTSDSRIDPLLGPLASNGGRTQTHQLLPGSRAINAGKPNIDMPPEFDQRGNGFLRVLGVRIDMGAVERPNEPPVVTVPGTQTVDEGVDLGTLFSFTDPDPSDTHEVTVDWGDGMRDFISDASTGVVVASHAYADDDDEPYTVIVTVTDYSGDSDMESFDVIVNNVDPTADAGGPYTVNEGGSVTLSATGSDVPGDSLSFDWDLDGDGQYDDAMGANVTFDATGLDGLRDGLRVVVGVRVSDGDGGEAFDTANVTVNNVDPTADAGGPYTVNEGGSVTLSATGSDVPGDSLSFDWDLDGDGQYDDAMGANVTFDATGLDGLRDGLRVVVGVRVSDGDGGEAFDTANVTVNNVDPTADAGGPYTVNEGGSVTLSATGSDVPGDSLSFDWDLDGDGQYDDAMGANVTFDATGLDGLRDGLRVVVGVRVSDGDGGEAFDTANVTVNNVDPTADAGGPYTVNEGGSVTLSATGSDVPGDSLSFDWDLDGDGQYDDAMGANVTFDATGLDGLRDGLRVVVGVRVSDGDGGEAFDTANVTVNNVDPTADAGGPYTVNEGGSVTLSATGSDVPGDSLSFDWDLDGDGQYDDAMGANVTFDATGLDGLRDGLRVVVGVRVSDGDGGEAFDTANVTVNNVDPTADAGGPYTVNEGGSVTLSATGSDVPGDSLSFDWDLDGDGQYDDAMGANVTFDATGLDGLRDGLRVVVGVRVSDGDGGEAFDTANVTVNNVDPTADAGGPYTVNEGGSVTLSATGSDVPGDSLSFDWDLDGDGQYDDAMGANVTFDATGLDGLRDGLRVVVGVRVSDGDGGEAFDTANVTVNNVDPTADAGGPYTVNEGGSVTLSATGSDVPGDSLSFDWDLDGDGQYDDAMGANVTFDATGLDGLRDGLRVVVGVRVSDGDGGEAFDTANVTVNNVDPTADAGGPYTVNEGGSVTLSATGSDVPGDSLSFDWDLDGDGQYDDAMGANVTFDATGLDGLRDGLRVVVGVRVSDGDGGEAFDTANVTVNNVDPTADAGGPYTVNEGGSVTLSATGSSDVSGDSLTFEWDLDNNGTFETTGPNPVFDPVALGFTGTQTRTVTLRVSDGDGGQAIATATLELRGVITVLPSPSPSPPPLLPLPPPPPPPPPLPLRTLLLPSFVVTLLELPESDGGAGGGITTPASGGPDSPKPTPTPIALNDELLAPRVVRREEIIDAVYSLGEFELVSLVGFDMGDEPVPPKKKVVEDQTKRNVAKGRKEYTVEKPADAVSAAFEEEETDFGPIALWSALAGGGTLWLGGAWWWHGQKRRRRSHESRNGVHNGTP